MKFYAIGRKLWETTLRPIASGWVIISVICSNTSFTHLEYLVLPETQNI